MNLEVAKISKSDGIQKLEKEAEEVRDKVTDIVLTLARRRHEIVDWLMGLRKERRAIGMSVVGAFCVAGGIALFMALSPRRKQSRGHQRRTSHRSPQSRRSRSRR
jgi:hypothetical protein